MNRFREPFPWEHAPARPEPAPLDLARVVALPTDAGRSSSSVVAEGEFAGVRDTRDELTARILSHTDGSDAARAWAAEKAATAATTWDRGVRAGSIKRHH